MSDFESWLTANDRYLKAAVAWLRARLERLANSDGAGGTEITIDLPLPSEMRDAELSPRPPALVLLSQRLGLSEFERHTLLLCAALEFDTRIGDLCARAEHDPARPYPTFALALALFDEPAWDVVSPERPLRRWRLVEINQPAAQPLIRSALRADERIISYLKGLNYFDDRLAPLMKPVASGGPPLPPSQGDIAAGIVEGVSRASAGGRLPVFQLLGSDTQSKLMIAQQAATALGLVLYRVPAEGMPAAAAEQENFLRLWQRESALMPVALYVDATQIDRSGGGHAGAVQRLLNGAHGVVFLDTREPWPDLLRETLLLDVAKPTPAEQRAAWIEALGPAAGEHPAQLAAQFDFNVPAIQSISALALESDPQRLGTNLWRQSLRRARPALDQLAQSLEPKATWDDLQLAPPEKQLLRQVAEQVKARGAVYDDWGFRSRMNRGFGISVLFAGESGTGKTMAAEVIANELDLLLYRIDLSAVVNKYIGETEKNLRKLFDAAENGGAILFFDEADALFGKRSEVKDSHDRYANIEINYLLQRMESYRGLAILATNMKAALDGAFLRRLRFVVNFAFPGVPERTAIWRRAFPRETPVASLDYERLARFNLTGGSIHGIALNAAFLAARAGTKVTMPVVLEALRTEFRKLEKPVNEADFRWLEPAVAADRNMPEARQ